MKANKKSFKSHCIAEIFFLTAENEQNSNKLRKKYQEKFKI